MKNNLTPTKSSCATVELPESDHTIVESTRDSVVQKPPKSWSHFDNKTAKILLDFWTASFLSEVLIVNDFFRGEDTRNVCLTVMQIQRPRRG